MAFRYNYILIVSNGSSNVVLLGIIQKTELRNQEYLIQCNSSIFKNETNKTICRARHVPSNIVLCLLNLRLNDLQ